MLDAPYPRQWKQDDLTQLAINVQTPIPAHHAHLFVREVHQQLMEQVPLLTVQKIEQLLLRPMRIWIQAYESAKVSDFSCNSKFRIEMANCKFSYKNVYIAGCKACGADKSTRTHNGASNLSVHAYSFSPLLTIPCFKFIEKLCQIHAHQHCCALLCPGARA